MNTHKGARLTVWMRQQVVRRVGEEGVSSREVALALGVSEKTVRKWVQRFLAEGEAGLLDRSSRPHTVRAATPDAMVEAIVTLRRQHYQGRQIAAAVGCSPATVSRVLRRAQLSRAADLVERPPVVRYERQVAGELLHLDSKALGRFRQAGHRVTGRRQRSQADRRVGWEYLHVAVDDYSRLAYVALLPDQRAESAVAFLQTCIAWYAAHGIRVTGIMTDNGPCYLSRAFRQACAELGLKHRCTRPYTPRTNGKAERFIRTALAEWAYGRSYPSSQDRAAALPAWLAYYNCHRPHQGVNGRPPLSRTSATRNNLLIIYS